MTLDQVIAHHERECAPWPTGWGRKGLLGEHHAQAAECLKAVKARLERQQEQAA